MKKYCIAVLSILGFLMLMIAVLLDKHTLMAKGVLSLLVEAVTLYLFFAQFRRLIITEKRIVLGLFTTGLILAYFILLKRVSPGNFLAYKSQMLLILLQIPVFLLLASYAISGVWEKRLVSIYEKQSKALDRVSFFSILLFAGLILFYSPLALHTSDPESLPFPLLKLLLWHVLFFSVSVILLSFFYRLAGRSLKPILASLFFSLALASWVYTYLLSGDYGVLDVVILTKPGRLIGLDRLYGWRERLLQLAEAVALATAFGGLIYLVMKHTRKLLPVAIVLNLMTLGQTAANVISNPDLWSVMNYKGGSGESFLPEATDDVYRFSRNGNIIIFMLDMFTGALIPEIFDEYPELEESFRGFVWYPSTLSVGTATFAGLPAILAGEDFAPHKVNERDDRLMSRMMEEAYSFYPSIARERGYEFTYVHPVYFNLEERAEEWDLNVVGPEVFKEYWLNTSPEAEALNLKMSPGYYSRLFSVIGLFKASPHFLRPYIYLEGRWLMQNRGQLEADHAITHLSVMDLWDSLSYVDDGPPQFKFIDNELAHTPLSIGSDLRLEMKASSVYLRGTEYQFNIVGKELPYLSSVRLLFEMAALLEWMKTQDIFDQTKIVLVSDHGYDGINDTWTDLPVIRSNDGTELGGSAGINALLMVKDYDSRESFRVDNRLMTTADTPLIALDFPDDPTRGEPEEREIFVNYTPVPPEENGRYQYIINYQFAVTGDPKNPENWRQTIP